MFPMIFLLLWKPNGGAAPVHVMCALSGDPHLLCTSSRDYSTVSSLEAALLSAGVPAVEMQTQLQIVRSGFPTFIKVTSYTARTLGVLTDEDASQRVDHQPIQSA